MINTLLMIAGGLGLILIAGGVLALVLEVMHKRPRRWPVLLTSGAAYLIGFVTEPPAAWAALNGGVVNPGTSLRTLALGVFLSVLSLSYIAACRGRRE